MHRLYLSHNIEPGGEDGVAGSPLTPGYNMQSRGNSEVWDDDTSPLNRSALTDPGGNMDNSNPTGAYILLRPALFPFFSLSHFFFLSFVSLIYR